MLKLSFRELCDSKVSVLYTFDMAISFSEKRGKDQISRL